MIRITMKDGGVIDIALDAKAAPITVENFEKLVKDHFYDGLIFHRWEAPAGISRVSSPRTDGTTRSVMREA